MEAERGRRSDQRRQGSEAARMKRFLERPFVISDSPVNTVTDHDRYHVPGKCGYCNIDAAQQEFVLLARQSNQKKRYVQTIESVGAREYYIFVFSQQFTHAQQTTCACLPCVYVIAPGPASRGPTMQNACEERRKGGEPSNCSREGAASVACTGDKGVI